MSYSAPLQAQNQFSQFDTSTPPPPPPKPSTHSSGQVTPLPGPPRPPPPPGQQEIQGAQDSSQLQRGDVAGSSSSPRGAEPAQPPSTVQQPSPPPLRPPQDGWLPAILKDKSTPDLQTLLRDSALQQALVQSPSTAHPSLPASSAQLQSLLDTNVALATSLKNLETAIQERRQATQSRLLSLRALERQWRAKQTEQDTALRDFSPPALYQRLSAAVVEQEALCRGLEESFVEEDGVAGEREVSEFVRRLREASRLAYLRREAKERWDETRVGGWR